MGKMGPLKKSNAAQKFYDTRKFSMLKMRSLRPTPSINALKGRV